MNEATKRWNVIFIKKLILPVILIIVLTKGYAQNLFISEIEFLGGPGLSGYWGSDNPDRVINWTYFFGGGVSHRFKNKFEVNAKLLFERKGSKMDYVETLYDANNVATTYRFIQGSKLDYLTLLLNLKYYLDEKDRFYAGLGGYISNLRKAATYTETQTLDGGVVNYYYLNDDSYNDFDFGLSATTGYYIPFRPKLTFNIQLIGNIGLSDIVKSEIPTEGPTKCFNLGLAVGFTFRP